ncbi:hypothetical protein PPL_10447 [Heterostelium album PN500]|uniref:Saposin B-type domain-containing protein n=1 Tax=Heterostelium pallidum (strain ATCC 26659 / Pp 5 / PN500) TaxID=670386 RepID=D3BR43_HETP5|nr:hypothetical protein PPL_10447 [Heterostelium album PN500]EFA75875.1 hypothetical protein PPL_10447 [Heterostelium album PN500]|eukprot:XP_020428009.1 hypothetical protein PPL_10447 [Heterostelium album PN500]
MYSLKKNKFVVLLLLFVLLVDCGVYSVSVKQRESKENKENKENKDDKVELCKFLVGYIKGLDNSEDGKVIERQQIKQELNEVCHFMPDQMSEVCYNMLSKSDFSIVEDILDRKLSSNDICDNSDKSLKIKQPQQQKPQLPKKPKQQQHQIINRISTDRLECNLCNFLVSQIEGYIQKNQTEEEIIADLEQSCNILGSMSTDCKELVADYMPEAIKRIMNKESPDVVCTEIGICTPTTTTTTTSSSSTTGGSNPTSKSHSGFECPSCEYLAGQVITYLKENQSISTMLQELNTDCQVFRDQSWIHICQKVVAEHGEELIRDVRISKSPSEACKMVGICGSTTSSSSSSSSSSTSNSGYSSGGSTATSGTSGTSASGSGGGYLSGSGSSGSSNSASSGDSGTGYAYRMTIN